MKKSGQIIFFMLFGISFLLSGCAPTFCSLNCTAPTNTPSVNQTMIEDFAQQEVNLMPKGNIVKIVLPADRFFQPGSALFKKNKKSTLAQVAQFMKAYGKTATVQILGFTDMLSSDEQNKKLSEARARAVLVYFWTQGLDANHLYAAGYGSEHLVGDPNNVSANAANRRVEIIINAHCTTCF